MRGIPGVADAHLAILETISDGRMHGIGEVTDSAARLLGVAEEPLRAVEKSGRSAFGMNVRRAAHNLRTAGLIKNGTSAGSR